MRGGRGRRRFEVESYVQFRCVLTHPETNLSITFKALILQVQLDQLLAHHVQLGLVVLLYDLAFRLSCLQLRLQVTRRLLFLLLHLVELLLPLFVFLHNLKRAALAQLVDTFHLVGHLADLLQGFLLE